MTSASDPAVPVPRRLAVIVGIALYFVTGFIYFTSGLVVPAPWLPVLWAVWLAGVFVVARLTARWSWWVLAAAPVALGFWLAYLAVGEELLGWRA